MYAFATLIFQLLAVLTVVGVVFFLFQALPWSRPETPPKRERRAPTNRPRPQPTLRKPEDQLSIGLHPQGLVAADQRVGLTETRKSDDATGDLVPIAAFASAAEASVVLERLRAAGINATSVGEHALRTGRTALPGIEVHVAEADAEAALALLEELNIEQQETPDEEEQLGVPPEKAGELVTVATYDSPIEAQLGLASLEEAGIRAILADDQLVATYWAISNSIGGIKLQVMGADAPAAVRVLAERAEAARTAPSESFTATPEDEEEPPNEAEATAERAAKGAVLGIMLWPIQFYVAYLLLKVAGSPRPLRPEYRNRAILAAILCIPFVLVMMLPARLLFLLLVTAGH
jgi:hypothetical protein